MALKEYRPGMDYGVGVFSLDGAIRGDGVIRTEVEEVTGASGQTVEFHLEKLETMEDLHKSLDVDVGVDVSFGPFGSGSGRFSFAEDCAMSSYSIYLLARVEVANSFRQMRDVKLKPQAFDLLKNGHMDRFQQQYGDHYVHGMATGGILYSVLEIQTSSETQQREIAAAVNVSAGLGAYKVSAEFSHAVNQAASRSSLTVRTFQQGGQDASQPQTVDEIIAKATNFPAQVAGGKAVPYEVLLQDYRALDLPQMPNWVDLQNAKEVLQDLWILRNQLRKNLNDVNFIRTHQQQFINPDIAKLNKAADDLSKALLDVTRAASRAINNPLEAQFPEIDIPTIKFPQRKGGKPKEFDISKINWKRLGQLLREAKERERGDRLRSGGLRGRMVAAAKQKR